MVMFPSLLILLLEPPEIHFECELRLFPAPETRLSNLTNTPRSHSPPTEEGPVVPGHWSQLPTHAEPLLVQSAARGWGTLHYLHLRLLDVPTGQLLILRHLNTAESYVTLPSPVITLNQNMCFARPILLTSLA